MGWKHFDVRFGKSNAVYCAGDTVTGIVEIEIERAKKIQNIHLDIKGEGKTYWKVKEVSTDGINGEEESTFTEFSGEEIYYSKKFYLIGEENSDSLILEAGKRAFRFIFVLPRELPWSFEGRLGFIRYTAKVVVNRPEKFNYEYKCAFTVLKSPALKELPYLSLPAEYTTDRYFNFCWCRSEPIRINMNIPKRGYVCGEEINVELSVKNDSDVKVNHVKIELIQSVTYTSLSPRWHITKDEEVIETESMTAVPPEQWSQAALQIKIPVLPPSNPAQSKIIDIDYELQMITYIDGRHEDEYGSIPIVITTFQLEQAPTERASSCTSPTTSDDIETIELDSENDSVFYAPYGNRPLLLLDTDHTQHTRYQDQFRPCYPLYTKFKNNSLTTSTV